MKPLYIIERHRYGWLIKSPPGERGVPMNALAEIIGIAPKHAVMANGVATALDAVFAIATPQEADDWEKEINEHLAKSEACPAKRWLHGTDTGLSALTIFITLVDDERLRSDANSHRECQGEYPYDSADFGRCQRLLDRMPGWEAQLQKVADQWPGTWAKIVAAWPTLKQLWTNEQVSKLNDILRELTKS